MCKGLAFYLQQLIFSISTLPDKGQHKYHKFTLSLADALEMALTKKIEYKISNKPERYFPDDL